MRVSKYLISSLNGNRESLNQTKAEFAKSLGLPVSTVSRILNGERTYINDKAAKAICRYLGVSLDQLEQLVELGTVDEHRDRLGLNDEVGRLSDYIRSLSPEQQIPFFALARGMGWEGSKAPDGEKRF